MQRYPSSPFTPVRQPRPADRESRFPTPADRHYQRPKKEVRPHV